MATSASPSEEDFACPVCCDIFNDPVVLLCGHSFCKHCLQEWWRQSELRTCPVCKESYPMAEPPRNLALRNLADALRRVKSQRDNSGSNEICSLHGEKLKLFCQDDQELICVICRDARRHKEHNCVPIDEAAEPCRAQLELKVLHLKTKLGSFKAEKLRCDKMAGHIKLQAQQTEKTIKGDFLKLHQFLRAEETTRVNAVRCEAAQKSEAMNIRIVNLTAEITSLTDKITTIERDTAVQDISLMLNVKSIMERTQCNLPEPETPSGALIDEAKHLGNLLFTVWEKMKNLILYTPVTLDPNTGGRELTISEHMTRSTESDTCLPLPENPERQSSYDILGSEGFSSGKHSWDVEVGGNWVIGVANKMKHTSSQRLWGITISLYTAAVHEYCTSLENILHEDSFPEKIRVQLDYDQGILSFFDLDRKTPVHTMKCTFTETVFPYFSENAKICPAELSVTIENPW